jgi:hypothetical protein
MIEKDVKNRFGLVPNFFRLAAAEPEITQNLWRFAQFAYLDNPLPSLFKERLFVYLSRFCKVRYCIARHLGFLIGLGYPAGDSSCLPQQIEAVLPLLRRELPRGEEMLPLFAACSVLDNPLKSCPVPDSRGEQALIACATHVFLQTPDATGSHEALRLTLRSESLEYLNVFLAFVRTAHYWTKLHPELAFEADIVEMLSTYDSLAQYVLNDPAAEAEPLSSLVGEVWKLAHSK